MQTKIRKMVMLQSIVSQLGWRRIAKQVLGENVAVGRRLIAKKRLLKYGNRKLKKLLRRSDIKTRCTTNITRMFVSQRGFCPRKPKRYVETPHHVKISDCTHRDDWDNIKHCSWCRLVYKQKIQRSIARGRVPGLPQRRPIIRPLRVKNVPMARGFAIGKMYRTGDEGAVAETEITRTVTKQMDSTILSTTNPVESGVPEGYVLMEEYDEEAHKTGKLGSTGLVQGWQDFSSIQDQKLLAMGLDPFEIRRLAKFKTTPKLLPEQLKDWENKVGNQVVRTPRLTLAVASVPPHEYPTLEQRENFFGTFTLSTSDVFSGDIVLNQKGAVNVAFINVPGDLLNVAGTTTMSPFKNHVMNSTEVEFFFKTNPAPNMAGKYVFTHIPAPDLVFVNNLAPHWAHVVPIFQRQGLGTATLEIGKQNDARYVVPYSLPQANLVLEDTEDTMSYVRNSGQLRCKCVVPLNTGDAGEQTLSVSVWFKFTHVQLNAVRYTQDITSQMYRTGNIDSILGDVWGAVESIPIIGSMADMLGNIVGEAAVGLDGLFHGRDSAFNKEFRERLEKIGVISGKGKNKGGAMPLGITRTAVADNIKVAPTSNPCLANAGESEQVHRLGLHRAVQNLDMTTDVTRISQFLTMPTLLRPVVISTSTPRGTILINLTTGLLNKKSVYNPYSVTGKIYYYGGSCAAAAATFEYYVGVKKYTFQVVKTAFHKLSLAIAGTPYTEVPDNVRAGAQYFKVMDFNDNDQDFFECPYVDKYGMRISPLSNATYQDHLPGAQLPPAEILPSATTNVGEVSIILTNSLVITGSSDAPLVSDSVTLLIWEEMLPESRMHTPVSPRCVMPLRAANLIPLVADVAEETTNMYLTGDFGNVENVQSVINTADQHDLLYPMLQRFTRMLDFTNATSERVEVPLTPRILMMARGSTTDLQPFVPTWFWMWASTFVYYSGSFETMCIAPKSVAENNSRVISAVFQPPRYVAYGPSVNAANTSIFGKYDQELDGGLHTMWSPQVNPVLSISTSQYTRAGWNMMRSDTRPVTQASFPEDNRIKSNGTLVFQDIGASSLIMKVLPKVGVDFRMHTFMGFEPMDWDETMAPLMRRKMVMDGRRTDIHHMSMNKVREMADATETWMEFEYKDIPSCFIPPVYRPIPLSNSAKKIKSQCAGLRMLSRGRELPGYDYDGEQLLLLSGDVEENPGPVFSTLKGKIQDGINFVSQPVVKPLNNIDSNIEEVTDKVGRAATSFEKVTEKLNQGIDGIENVVTSLFDTIKASVNNIPNPEKLWQALLHFVHAWVNPVKKTMGISFLGIFSALGLIPVTLMTKGVELFGKICESWFRTPEEVSVPEEQTPISEMKFTGDEITQDAWQELASFVLSCVCVMFGQKCDKSSIKGLFSGLVLSAPKTFTMTTHVTRFLKNTFELFKRCYNYIVSKLPGADATRYIVEHTDVIEKFVPEASLMVNPANFEALKTQPKMRQRFWSTVMVAHFLQNSAALNQNLKYPPALTTLIRDVLKISEQLTIPLMCCPVRYEPFTVALCGPSNIGKSYVTQTLVCDMLESINYTTYDSPIFVRTPGNQYWNGCSNQPCVLYDDFLAVNGPEFSAVQLAELFALKTTAVFNPPMADLSDKRLRYNPLIVWMCANQEYPALNGVRAPEAVYRRRDVLIAARLKPGLKRLNMHNPDSEILKKFDHLEFAFKNPVKDHDKTTWMGYQDMRKTLLEKFQVYHTNEKKNVQHRLEELQRLLPEQAARIPTGVDPFQLFYEAQLQSAQVSPSQSGCLPSETMETIMMATDAAHNSGELLEVLRKMREKMDKRQTVIPIVTYNAQDEIVTTEFQRTGDEVGEFYDALTPEEQAELDRRDIENLPENQTLTRTPQELQDGIRRVCSDAEHARHTYAGSTFSTVICNGFNWMNQKVVEKVCPKLVDPIMESCAHVIQCEYVIKCVICSTRTVCKYKCGNAVCHPICETCFEGWSQQTVECPLRCGFNMQRWTVRDITEQSMTAKVKSLLALFAYTSLLGTQKFWNFCSRYALLFDVAWLCCAMICLPLAPIIRSRRATAMFNEYITDYNSAYGTDYVLRTFHDGDRMRYMAVSASNFADRYTLTGDEEPSTSGVKNVKWEGNHGTVYDVEGGVQFSVEFNLEPQKLEMMIDRPVKCAHNVITPVWKYVGTVHHGAWMLDDDTYVEDALCSNYCRFADVKQREIFLREWAAHHYADLRDHINGRSMQKYGSSVAPSDFKSCEAVENRPKKFGWLTNWIQKLKLREWWHWLCEKFVSYFQLLKVATCVIGVVCGVGALVSFVKGRPVDNLQPSGYATGKTIIAKAGKSAVPTGVMMHTGDAELHHKVGLIWKNVAWITGFTINGTKQYCVKSVFLRDRWLLMTKHQFARLVNMEKDGCRIVLCTVRGKFETKDISIKNCKFNEYIGYDCVSVYISPTYVSSYRSIIPFITKDKNVSHVKREACIVCPELTPVPTITMHDVVILSSFGSFEITEENGEKIQIEGVYLYQGYSGRNSCGALLLQKDNNCPLIGIHFSSNTDTTTGCGSSVPLTADVCESLAPSVVADNEPPKVVEKQTPMVMTLCGDIDVIGHIDSQMVPYQAADTKIQRSLIADELEKSGIQPVTEPTILSKRDKRWKHKETPLVSGCNKHGQPHMDFPERLMQTVIRQMEQDFIVKCKPVLTTVGRRTVKEAICGILGNDRYPAIDMTTSVGWPLNKWKRDGKMANRKTLLNPIYNVQDQMVDVELDSEFEVYCQERDQMRRQGIIPFTVYWDHLKDERRKPEKAYKLGGTRIFSLSPLDFLIQHRQMYMDFSAAWHSSWIQMEHGVGIACDGPQWSQLATTLLAKGPNIICLDYKDFGPTLSAPCVRAVDLAIRKWYLQYTNMGNVEQDDNIREIMTEEVASPIHLCQDFLYRTYAGIPSGHPATTMFNTEVNKMQIKMAWLALAPLEYRSLLKFREHVALFCYGDDVIMSVSDVAFSFFHGIAIIKWFEKFNIVVTSQKKDGIMCKGMRIEEATFLKRGFMKHEKRSGEWLAPLDLNSVRETAFWIHKGNEALFGTQVNIEQSIRLAFGHGEKFFYLWQKKLNEMIAKVQRGLEPVCLDWDDLDDTFFV
uniref:Polyprotein n=1 Tax=Cryptotermes secundus iflavirus 1 TaxID=3032214 RepID=A0AAT9JAD5_9VIRU